MDNKKELLLKLQELAKRGVNGEKENADKSLRIASLNTAVQEATAENKRLKETVDRYKSQIGGYKSEVQKQLKDIEDKTSISKLKIIEKQLIRRIKITK